MRGVRSSLDRRRTAASTQPEPQAAGYTLDGFTIWCACHSTSADGILLSRTGTPPRRPQGALHGLGLDVSGTAIRTDFCVNNATTLKQEIDRCKRWVEHTSRLGGKTIRIFGGTVPRGDTEERARRQCVDAIQECCEHAGQFGIYLALENHGGITGTSEQMLALVRGIKSDWFGVNLDTGNFRTRTLMGPDALAPMPSSCRSRPRLAAEAVCRVEGRLRRKTQTAARVADYVRRYVVGGIAKPPRTRRPRYVALCSAIT